MADKSILKTVYLPPVWKRKDTMSMRPGEFPMEMVSDAALFLNIKDNTTGETTVKLIEKPMIEFYTVKHNHRSSFPKMYMEEEYLDKHVVEYAKRDREISKEIGKLNEFNAAKRSYNGDQNFFRNWMTENIYNNPDVYHADVDIEDYYKTLFIEKHGINVPKLNRAFADIETLVCLDTSANQNKPNVPINVITYFDERMNTLYGFVLHIKGVKEVDEVVSDPNKFIKEYLETMLDETYEEMYTHFENTHKGYVRPEKRPHINIDLRFYKEEELLIIDFHRTLKANRPDICGWWNMNYDMKYQIGRCERLGIDYNDLFCDDDIPEQYRRCWYVEDKERYNNDSKKKKTFQQMWDYLVNPGCVEFFDMMSYYANARKRFQEKSYKLDYITEKVLGTKKVDLNSYGCTIVSAPMKQFKIFLKYSFKDTFLLKLLDDELRDMPNYYVSSGNTKTTKRPSVTVCLKNIAYRFLRQSGKVIGNNVKYKEWESLEGALVASPQLIAVDSDNKGLRSSNIFSHIADFDASSMYPNNMEAFNIGKDASFGRILHVYDGNSPDKELLMPGADYAHYLQTCETGIFDLGTELFGLPSIQDMMSMIEDQSKGVKNGRKD